jgi:hypothetical protein
VVEIVRLVVSIVTAVRKIEKFLNKLTVRVLVDEDQLITRKFPIGNVVGRSLFDVFSGIYDCRVLHSY